MKVLILNLLISYILCIYSSNSTISRKLFNLTIHGTIGYNGNTPSLTILDLSGCKDDVIYITYKINRRDFNTDIIYYEFTDVYPNEYFECANQMKSSIPQLLHLDQNILKLIHSNYPLNLENKIKNI